MTLADLMMITVLGGFALCAEYFRAQYKDWRKQRIAEAQGNMRMRLLHWVDTRRPSDRDFAHPTAAARELTRTATESHGGVGEAVF
jgi:hypothetical protein